MKKILTLNFDKEITGQDIKMELVLSEEEMNRLKSCYHRVTLYDATAYEFQQDFAELLSIFEAMINPNIIDNGAIFYFGVGYMDKFLKKYFR